MACPGNDDYGTMSAWYTFAAMGLYPVTGMSWYYLGSPVHDRVGSAIRACAGVRGLPFC